MTNKSVIFLLIIIIVVGGCSNMNTSDNYDKLFTNYLDMWNTGDFTNIETTISEDFELKYVHSTESILGINGFKEHITQTRKAYPNFTLTIEEHFNSSNVIAIRWSLNATQFNDNGENQIRSNGISILHMEEGILIDEWIAYDRLDWMEQLGYNLSKQE